ncbi:hypothetical protein TNIN_388621 [Trichonephila inaurata madagascariensis]|uniref:Uncharacterized protein n=1 Tax=Trichonephila inaurata madagascariensis TaxID=2747483 RepID=A0A8X6M9T8_9ARAC|nr:hypothetical protein TNIN_388621 [Trichonephila inaurata madagascariensis]
MKYLRLLTHLDEGIDRNKDCLDCFSKQEDPKLRYARVYLGLSQDPVVFANNTISAIPPGDFDTHLSIESFVLLR